jgi:hypothetical protein
MEVVAIDVGYTNFALVSTVWVVDDDGLFTMARITHAERINLARYKHCTRPQCVIPHTLFLADLMSHLFQEYNNVLSRAVHVYVENQPPTSWLRAIQELILFHYRSKTTPVSPLKVQKWYGIRSFTYDERKVFMVDLMCKILEDVPCDAAIDNERTHDVADALAIAQYQLCQANNKTLRTRSKYFRHKNANGLARYHYMHHTPLLVVSGHHMPIADKPDTVGTAADQDCTSPS